MHHDLELPEGSHNVNKTFVTASGGLQYTPRKSLLYHKFWGHQKEKGGLGRLEMLGIFGFKSYK
jgi:hypothetical protein